MASDPELLAKKSHCKCYLEIQLLLGYLVLAFGMLMLSFLHVKLVELLL